LLGDGADAAVDANGARMSEARLVREIPQVIDVSGAGPRHATPVESISF
jgi:hypothetical protein